MSGELLRLMTVMDATAVEAAVGALADRISDHNKNEARLVLVGIQKGGVPLTLRLAERVSAKLGRPISSGQIDPSLHRDDLSARGARELLATHLPFDIDGCTVVLVDDVLFTGRTVRASMDSLHDYGRAARIELAVLIDRGHRELPICANYVGNHLATSREQRVEVKWKEVHGQECVLIESKAEQ